VHGVLDPVPETLVIVGRVKLYTCANFCFNVSELYLKNVVVGRRGERTVNEPEE
jgi:hypothetical protein